MQAPQHMQEIRPRVNSIRGHTQHTHTQHTQTPFLSLQTCWGNFAHCFVLKRWDITRMKQGVASSYLATLCRADVGGFCWIEEKQATGDRRTAKGRKRGLEANQETSGGLAPHPRSPVFEGSGAEANFPSRILWLNNL